MLPASSLVFTWARGPALAHPRPVPAPLRHRSPKPSPRWPPRCWAVGLGQSWERFGPLSSTRIKKLLRCFFLPVASIPCTARAAGKKVAICLEFALKSKRKQSPRTASPRTCYSSSDPPQPWHGEHLGNDFSESRSPGETPVYNYSSVT